MRTRLIGVAVAGVSAVVLAFAGGAAGIVGGTPDTAAPYKYPAVGMVELYGYAGDFWLPACTGTLVAPDVVLTAGHCTIVTELGLVPPSGVRITFDPAPQSIYFPHRPASTHFGVAAAVTYPEYITGAGVPGNGLAAFGQASDVGVYVLAEPVPAEVATPMPIVGAGALDDVEKTTFTSVGYGFTGFARGAWSTPSAVAEIDGYRSYVDQTVITDHGRISGLFLKTTGGTCMGDSGGPFLLDGEVAAVTAAGASPSCAGPGWKTRLDTEGVQAFLGSFLANGD